MSHLGIEINRHNSPEDIETMGFLCRKRRNHIAVERRKRPSNRRSDSHRVPENNEQKNSSEKKKRNHLLHLRNITARLLREDSEIRSIPYDEVSKNTNSKKKKHKEDITKTIEKTTVPEPFQKIKPWVERSKIEEGSMWVEATPMDIVSVHQQSDTMTEHTTLCSAFEMLSFENLCNTGNKSNEKRVVVVPTGGYTTPLKVVGHTPAEDDGFKVPREIAFENHDVCTGCVNGASCMPKEGLPTHRKRKQKKVFMKRLLPFKQGKTDNENKIMKVKVYVDPPRPQGCNNSIGNSTLTMPKELMRSITSTTI